MLYYKLVFHDIKYTISKDKKYYRAFTDLIEINKETDEYNICYCESHDNGESWSEINKMPIPACHRPIITKLRSGNYLITYSLTMQSLLELGFMEIYLWDVFVLKKIC